MDCYDLLMARAKEVSEHRRQEEVEDNNIKSNSELSELASCEFDGMDIEGVKSGDIHL
jgi:hypothetical protein